MMYKVKKRLMKGEEFEKILEEWRKDREENQRRWEEHKEEDRRKWEENQRRWEENQKVIRELLRTVAKHGEILGYSLESMASGFVPYILSKKGIRVKKLSRRFIYVNKREIEINLFGEGLRKIKGKKGSKVAVLVECKSSIYERDVRRFLRKIEHIEPWLKERGLDAVRVFFSYYIHPSAYKLASEKGIMIVSSVPHYFE